MGNFKTKNFIFGRKKNENQPKVGTIILYLIIVLDFQCIDWFSRPTFVICNTGFATSSLETTLKNRRRNPTSPRDKRYLEQFLGSRFSHVTVGSYGGPGF